MKKHSYYSSPIYFIYSSILNYSSHTTINGININKCSQTLKCKVVICILFWAPVYKIKRFCYNYIYLFTYNITICSERIINFTSIQYGPTNFFTLTKLQSFSPLKHFSVSTPYSFNGIGPVCRIYCTLIHNVPIGLATKFQIKMHMH